MTGSDAIRKGSIAWIVVAAMILSAENGFGLSGSICGKDLNGDGQITTNEFQQCISTGGGYLCPIDAVNCSLPTYSCPNGGTLSGTTCVVTSTYVATATTTGGVDYSVFVCKNAISGALSVSSSSCAAGSLLSGYMALASFNGSVAVCENAMTGALSVPGTSCIGGLVTAGYTASTTFSGSVPVCQDIISGALSVSGSSCGGNSVVAGYIALSPGVFGGTTTYSCNTGDTLSGTTCTHTSTYTATYTGPLCPYGVSYPCLLNGSTYQCSDVSCGNTVTTQADTTSYQNDGQVDPNSGQCLGQIYIFNGKGGTCKEPGFDTNFFQCCTIDPGSFLFVEAVCGTNDMETSEAMYAQRTHYVGSFCTDSWPLIGCVQTARTYCIFQSKLGRIIQEQGRMQLKAFQDANGNPYWGTPEFPNCRGFTPQEFQSLDFSKMDLSEYFADIKTKANAAIQQDMKNNVQNYYNNLP